MSPESLRIPASLAFTLLLGACAGGPLDRIATEPGRDAGEDAGRAAAAPPASQAAAPPGETRGFEAGRSIEEGDLPAASEDRQPPPATGRDRATAGSETAEPDEGVDEEEPGEAGEAPRGFYHLVQRGQTLYSLARLYGVPLQELMRVNGLHDPRSLAAGKPILIPGAPPRTGRGAPKAPPAAPAVALAWPIRGAITGPFGRRSPHHQHVGVDIDGETGDPIHAAASGEVVYAGVEGAYGRLVVIDHGDGLMTLYAHASRLEVREGQHVRAGQEIALVGESGNAHGSHLHFEVRQNGRPINPLPYLRAGQILTAGVAPAPAPPGGKTSAKRARPARGAVAR